MSTHTDKLKELASKKRKKKGVEAQFDFEEAVLVRERFQKKHDSKKPTVEDENDEAAAAVLRTMALNADAEMDRQNNLLLRGEIPEFTTTNQSAFKLSARAHLIKPTKNAKVASAVARAKAIDGKIPAFRQNVRGAVKKTNFRSRRSLREQTTTISDSAPKPKRGTGRDFSADTVGGGGE